MTTYCYKDQSKMASARLPIAVSHSDLLEIDNAASGLGINRTSFIRMAIQAQLKALTRHG